MKAGKLQPGMVQSLGSEHIERLMRIQALRARPRRRQLPKDTGTRSIVAPNTLERNFEAAGRPEPQMGRGLHLYLDCGRLALSCRSPRPVLPAHCRLVDEGSDDHADGHRRPDDGHLEKGASPDADASL